MEIREDYIEETSSEKVSIPGRFPPRVILYLYFVFISYITHLLGFGISPRKPRSRFSAVERSYQVLTFMKFQGSKNPILLVLPGHTTLKLQMEMMNMRV